MEMRGGRGRGENNWGKREEGKLGNFLRAQLQEGREVREREGSTPLSIPHRCLQMSPCRGRLGT